MTTRTRPSSRRFRLLRFALLLAIAWVGTAGRADADVTAVVVNGELRVTGDDFPNQIRLLQSSDGLRIEIWVGNIFLVDRPRAIFTTIRIDAGGGDDSVLIDETLGVFTDTEITTIDGGAGTDTIAGGIGAETIFGGAGNDTIDAGRGVDVLHGGEGDDRFVWNANLPPLIPADGADTIDGDAGTDTLEVNGNSQAESYGISSVGDRALVARSSVVLDVGTTERLDLEMAAGDDSFFPTSNFTSAWTLLVDGGDGADTILGSIGNDTLVGGSNTDPGADTVVGAGGHDTLLGGGGDDTVDGQGGDDIVLGGPGVDQLDGGSGNDTLGGGASADTVLGGSGDDRLVWFPGDANDTNVDGQLGVDTFVLAGSNGSEALTLGVVPNGIHVSGSMPVSLDLVGVERVEALLADGNDTVVVGQALDQYLERVTLDLGGGADTVSASDDSGLLVLDGGASDQDTLNFDVNNHVVDVRPGTIATLGVRRVTHVAVEIVNIVDPLGVLPSIAITSPTSAPATTSAVPFMALGGSTSDTLGTIQSVTWSNDRGGSGIASGTTAWSIADVPLQPGVNVITVSALDNHGNSVADAIGVTVSTLTYLLAEGATGSFFDLDVLLANPTTTPAPVTVTFLRQTGSPIVLSLTLPPTSRQTIHVDQVAGLEDEGGVSTVVASTAGVPIVVERSMFWDQSYYGSHGGTAVDGPRTRWLFAEGSEGFFNTFVLLANPGATASNVTLSFLREGSTPFVHQVTVQPNARVTVAANAIPELVGHSFSIVVDATSPIIAERAMYFGTARIFDGGHESTGVPEGAQSWFLAEGATGPFFETFVLIGNPNAAAATVAVTFLTDSGLSVVRNKTVPANGRLTINIETEDPQLANVAVSTAIVASQPVVVERAMYWPGPPSTWAEAHNSFGATFVSAKWGLAEGRVGMAHGFETYILLANPNTTAADVRITFLRANGSTVVKTVTVAPSSRFNVAASSAAPELQNEAFGALIEVTNGLGIGVERAMYSNALGQTWAAGTNALATRLP